MSRLILSEQSTSPSTPSTGKAAIFVDSTPVLQMLDDTGMLRQATTAARFRLAANGSAIGPSIADFFGSTSAFSTEANAVYELCYYVYYLKTTAGTVTYTITNTQTYTNVVAMRWQSAAAGMAASGNVIGAGIVSTTTAAAALPATASLTTAVNHWGVIRAIAEVGTAGNIRLRVTSSAGTVTPLRGSFYYARRLSSSNVGTFVA